MIFFAASDYYKKFIESIDNVEIGDLEVLRYPNGEMHAKIVSDVAGKPCFIIGSIAPPDEQLLSVLMLADALKRKGASSLHLFVPYLGYSRQDKFEKGGSGGIELIGSLLRAAGIDMITTLDVHSKLDQKLIGLPLTSVISSDLFKIPIQELGWDNVTILAPDEGAITRAQAMSDLLGYARPVAHLVKKHVDGIVHYDMFGEVGEKVVIVDDIIDGGNTAASACSILREKSVKEIAIAVTHGLFTGGAWDKLGGLDIKALFVTDSCPEALKQMNSIVKIISIKTLIPDIIAGTARKG